ncbi:hypothetical protein WUBG_02808, partial [Wuchereria bancrofti]
NFPTQLAKCHQYPQSSLSLPSLISSDQPIRQPDSLIEEPPQLSGYITDQRVAMTVVLTDK